MTNIFKGTQQYQSTVQNMTKVGKENPIVDTAGFSDRVKSAFDVSFKQGTQFGRGFTAESIADGQRELHLKHNTNVFATVRYDLMGGIPAAAKSPVDIIRANNEKIEALKKRFPDAGFKSFNDIEEEFRNTQREILDSNRDLAERSSGLGKVGAGVGYIAGHLADPINLGTLALGPAAKAGAVGQSFLRVGASEAAIEAAIQAKDKPGEVGVRRAIGEKVTTGEAVAESATAVGLAGLIGGAVGAIFSKLGAMGDLANPVSNKTANLAARARKAIEKGEINPTQDILDHINLMEEATGIAGAKPDGVNQVQHFKDYESVRGAIEAGEDLPGVSQRGFTEENLADAAEIDPQGVEATELVNNLRQKLQEEDVLITEIGEDGLARDRSGAATLRELGQEEKGLTQVDTCVKGGQGGTE